MERRENIRRSEPQADGRTGKASVGGNRDKQDLSEQIQVLSAGRPEYPALLAEIKDPPKTLYYIGNIELLRGQCAAVVGSRTTTAYGRNTARSISRCLAGHGAVVVSGLASGIDTCAHEGALEAGGDTIAVLGCGPDLCYPAENRRLKDMIAGKGLILSEYPPGMGAMAYHFPQRNRIISGLSEIVIVVQARLRSGALITADLAAEQGRELFAVPGNIDSQYNLGSNQLIRDGAGVITCIDDVLEPLGLAGCDAETAARSLSGTEFRVYEMLRAQGELSADELCMQISCRPGYLLPILSSLELKGFIRSAAGKFFLANP